jgi:hypothetical protein
LPSLVDERSEPLDTDRLRECLQGLAERDRTVLLMTFYDDQPAQVVGTRLGLSAANVRVVRHQGIERLRRCMKLDEELPRVSLDVQRPCRCRSYLPTGSERWTTSSRPDSRSTCLAAAPLQDVRRLDLIFEGKGWRQRLQDIAFDPASGEVVFAPSVAELRKLGVTTQRAQLVAVSPEAERVIGNYTFNHSPYR